MARWESVTIGEVTRGLARYRPYVIAVGVVLLIAAVAPGEGPLRTTDAVDESSVAAGTPEASAGGATTGDGSVPNGGVGGAAGGASSGSTAGSAGGTGTSGAVSGGGSRVAARAVAGTTGSALDAPDCDAAVGRVRFPSVYAPPCVGVWPKDASNGGATARGITKDEILVAIRFNPNPDPAGQAILLAAGIDDTTEQVRATRQGYVDLLTAHFRTYGRKVRIVYVPQSGTDEQAQRADALKIATEVKAFAVWGGSGAFKDELVARGVLCIGCTTSEPIENYLKAAPYVWSTLMASTQAYMHRAEYIGKRLWGRNAKWAGDPVYQQQKRKLGLVYIETEQNTYKAGVDFFERELAKYGAKLTVRISYLGDLATAQEQSRVIIAKLKDAGITTVVFAGDPIAPAFLTKEATNQQYFPEYVITGSALTDTAVFARTYDQQQWSHAFGVSMLSARGPREQTDAWSVYQWHHGRGPEADDSFGVIYPTPFAFFLGVHMAGPRLTVQTFRDGMFALPISGAGGITNVQMSYGKKGIWPWDDYLAYDDMTEIWWDPAARGEDETGTNAVGLYRYVEGGKRYAAGAWPATEPKAFDPNGTVLVYDQRPAADKPPNYEHKHY